VRVQMWRLMLGDSNSLCFQRRVRVDQSNMICNGGHCCNCSHKHAHMLAHAHVFRSSDETKKIVEQQEKEANVQAANAKEIADDAQVSIELTDDAQVSIEFTHYK